MLSQQLEGAPTYREKPRQQLEGLFFAKDISTFIQKELEDSMVTPDSPSNFDSPLRNFFPLQSLQTNFELSVEEAAIIARLARQQQWLFDDENKMLQHKVLITKTLLELHQQRMNQVQQQAGQAADIELKVEDYIHHVRTTKGPNAQPKVNLEPDTDAEPPFDSEPDTDAESSDSEVEDWEMDQNEENFVVTCKDNMYTISNGTYYASKFLSLPSICRVPKIGSQHMFGSDWTHKRACSFPHQYHLPLRMTGRGRPKNPAQNPAQNGNTTSGTGRVIRFSPS
ncbi:hypothetical protein BT96DRAFT_1105324 [Gymnopus androsaceus JB14]|uniref:Uncharacterized protein n=1 Tax=Gymnopus androsaceus JB14 TaxID=1447944 RepID=A0A6A4GE99_9AGAR|nr:hypothetical protein BT96DRAFT_1105324 [Gymnopus androsaceus JB14]